MEQYSRKKRREQQEIGEPAKKKKRSKVVSIIIYVIGGCLILGGLYIVGQPIIGGWQTNNRTADLLERVKTGTDLSYTINVSELPPLPEDFLGDDWLGDSSNYDPDTGNLKVTVIGRLILPKIECDLPVLDNWGKQELRVGLGHMPGSAMPGQVGNCVIAGHRSYTYDKQFNRMREVEIGDEFELWDVQGNGYKYRVFEIEALLPSDERITSQDYTDPVVTLMTCDPIYVATHRLCVRGVLIDKKLNDE